MKKVLMLVMVLCFGLAGTVSAGDGQLVYELWEGITGTAVVDLTSNAAYPDTPTTSSFLTEFHAPVGADEHNDFGGRITGFIKPSISGIYDLYLSADDGSELWLSPTEKPEDAVLVASVPGWTADLVIDKYASQKGTVPLFANQSYYAMAIYKEGGGGDNCAVQWAIGAPGDANSILPLEIVGTANISTDHTNVTNRVENEAVADDPAMVPLAGTTLSWAEPADTTGIIKYNVYLSTSMLVGDPNDGDSAPSLIGTVLPGGTMAIATGALENDTVYYWRVNAMVGAKEAAVGYLQSFKSINAAPIITAQPQSQTVGLGCSAEIAVEVISGEDGSGGILSYKWFKGGVEMTGEIGASIIVTEAADYHVEITNDAYTMVSQAAALKQVGMVSGALLVSDGLLGYWPFDGDATDASGNGWNLTQSGDPQFVEGMLGQAIECDGAGDYFSSAAFADSLNGNEALSVVMWVKSDVIDTDKGFLAFQDPSGNDQRGIRYDTTGYSSGGDDVLKYGVAGSNGQQQEIETPSFMQVTEWQHIALTWVGTGEDIKFYINGELIPGVNTDGQATGGLAGYNNMHIGRGGKDDNATGEGWDGLIDDVAIYDRALSIEEIQTIMSAQGGWAPTDPTYNPPATADGWIDPTVDVTVGWTKADLGPCDATYRVSIGQEPNDLFLTEVGTTQDTSIVVPASMLAYDSTYYWKVVVEREGESVAGPFWSFDTVKRVPVILTNPATQVIVDAGSTASLSAQVSSLKVVPLTKYVWRKEGDPSFEFTVNNQVAASETENSFIYDCFLDLDAMDVSKEGTYYCTLFNNATGENDFIETTRTQVLTRRLMLHYTFDEIVNDTVADSSASGITGNLVSPVAWATDAVHGGVEAGIVGGAIRLTGSQDPNSAFVETGKTSFDLGVDGAKPRTVSVWAKVRRMNNGGLWDAGNYGTNGRTWGLRTLSGNFDRWRVQHWGGAFDSDFDYVPSFESWVHFVYSYDGTRNKVYANGEQVVNAARALNTGNNVTLHVGAYRGNIFDGLIDDFQLYNYALSAKEIGQLYVDVVGGTVCVELPLYDFNGDCIVGLADFAEFAVEWMNSSLVTP